jgi:hypothetical protein
LYNAIPGIMRKMKLRGIRKKGYRKTEYIEEVEKTLNWLIADISPRRKLNCGERAMMG